MKTRFVLGLIVAAGVAGTAGAAVQDINGLQLVARNFNDFGLSTLSYNHNGGPATALPAPGTLAINTLSGVHNVDESIQPQAGNFANRHLVWFSADGGATPYSFDASQSFRASARVTVRTTFTNWAIGAARSVEAGFWAHVPRRDDNTGANYTDEGGIFTVTNGTTFVGGAGLPFNLFGEGGFNNPANPPFFTGANVGGGFTEGAMDQTFIYQAPSGMEPGYIRVLVTDVVSGVSKDSGWLAINNSVDQFGDNSNLWNPGTTFGFRMQNPPTSLAVTTDFHQSIGNLSIIPAPGAMGLLGLGGLLAARRRR